MLTHDGKPVVLGALPDPRAWLGREADRPAALVAAGHFVAFDTARSDGSWTGGNWPPTLDALKGKR